MQQHFDATSGEGWFTGRYRQFLAPGKAIPLAITEAGVDVVPPVGWKNHYTGEEYLEQLTWYDSVLLEDDYVLGATIFALEIPGWWSFDTRFGARISAEVRHAANRFLRRDARDIAGDARGRRSPRRHRPCRHHRRRGRNADR